MIKEHKYCVYNHVLLYLLFNLFQVRASNMVRAGESLIKLGKVNIESSLMEDTQKKNYFLVVEPLNSQSHHRKK